ncbi:POK18 protein, partial [Ardeotis kori]|nr:POK18 protein [Ardeotis kori]
EHVTGIPHNPTGQAIIERAHGTLKNMLLKQEGAMEGKSASEKLAKAMYVLNFLNQWSDNSSPIQKHFGSSTVHYTIRGQAPVMIKNLETGNWEGP